MRRRVWWSWTVGVVLLGGCAIGRVTHSDGTVLQGIVVGQTHISACYAPQATLDSAGAAFVGQCDTISGGAVSTVAAGIMSTLATFAAMYFTHGGF